MIFIFVFLIAALGIGLLVSTVAKTQQQAMMLAVTLTSMPAILLSGFVFPIESMPPVLQMVTYIIPARFFLIALRGIFLKGIGLGILWPEFVALILFALILMVIATLRFKKRLD